MSSSLTTQNSKQQKSSAKKQQLLCRYCDTSLQPDQYYVCHCGYEMCWECFDDLYKDKQPYCPKCDAYLVSDSDDEIIKQKSQNSESASSNSSQSQTLKLSRNSSTNSSTTTPSSTDLAKVRVIKKNLVYVIGLSPEIAHEDILTRREYFSQYGKITKIVVNTSNAYNPKGPNGPSYSAYITYSNEREASIAILASEEFEMNGRVIRASYGTTKYCQYFLKQQECPNVPDCLYLHSYSKDKEFFSKEETATKSVFLDQQKMAIKHIQKHIPDLIKIKNTPLGFTSILPSPISVINKLIETNAIDIKSVDKQTSSVESKTATPPKTQQPTTTSTTTTVNANSNSTPSETCAKKKKVDDNTPLVDQWSLDLTPIVKPQPKPTSVTKKTSTSNSTNASTTLNTMPLLLQQNSSPAPIQTTPSLSDKKSISTQPTIPQNNNNTTSIPIKPTVQVINKQPEVVIKSVTPLPPQSQLQQVQLPSTSTPPNSKDNSAKQSHLSNSTSKVSSTTAETNKQNLLLSQQQQQQQSLLRPQSTPIDSTSKDLNNVQAVGIEKQQQQQKKTIVVSANTSSQNSNSQSTTPAQNSNNQQKNSTLTTLNPLTKQVNQSNIIYEKKDSTLKKDSQSVSQTPVQKQVYVPVSQVVIVKQSPPQQTLQPQPQQQQQQESKKSDIQSVQATNNIEGDENNNSNINPNNNTVIPKYRLEKVPRIEKRESNDSKIMKRLILSSSAQQSGSRFEFARSEDNWNNQACGGVGCIGTVTGEYSDLLDHLIDGKYLNLIKPQVIKKVGNNNSSKSGTVH